jgi:hypothetical protein
VFDLKESQNTRNTQNRNTTTNSPISSFCSIISSLKPERRPVVHHDLEVQVLVFDARFSGRGTGAVSMAQGEGGWKKAIAASGKGGWLSA